MYVRTVYSASDSKLSNSENKSAQKTVCHCVYTNSYITKFDIQGYLCISSA